jgi:hypothetical protein
MKKQKIYYLAVILFLLSFLASCGGGGAGAPGTGGMDDIGVTLEAEILPYYLSATWTISDDGRRITTTGNFTNAVDVTQVDCDPDPNITELEPMASHTALLVVNAKLLNPNSPFKPGTLFITEYRIDYFRSTDSLTAPPIESVRRYVTILITPPSDAGNRYSAASVEFVDLIRKFEYVRLIDGGMYASRPGYLNNYTAEYTFYGKDSHDKSFSFKVRADFSIGAYNYCGLL